MDDRRNSQGPIDWSERYAVMREALIWLGVRPSHIGYDQYERCMGSVRVIVHGAIVSKMFFSYEPDKRLVEYAEAIAARYHQRPLARSM